MFEFTKMHGLGNDFICINQIENKNYIQENRVGEFARYFCDRNFGIGADGVILIKESRIADVKMEIINKDGSIANMCGNGIRCLSKYIFDRRIVDKTKIGIETRDGIKQINVVEKNNKAESIIVNMGKPKYNAKEIPIITKNTEVPIVNEIKVLDREFIIYTIFMGNPHSVIIVDDVEKVDIDKYGKLIEENQIFPDRTNVDFIQIQDKSNIKMRVWERGVGETLGCGTGACASVVVSNLKELVFDKCNVKLKGGDLKIRFQDDVFMEGIATEVFNGIIDYKI